MLLSHLNPLRRWRLTLFGSAVLLMSCELLANGIVWAAAGILFGRKAGTRNILTLALLAWTFGLRHALDADHIRYKIALAIDNATRTLLSSHPGSLPITCGLYFSLGHSTIVLAFNIAIAISTGVAKRSGGFASVGGVIGSAVSATFLLLIALGNTFILCNVYRKKRARNRRIARGEAAEPENYDEPRTIMMKILGPVKRFVNRPWKMYIVGVLFGLSFDTASSISLLALSAIARKGTQDEEFPTSYIVVFPFIFTAGMSMIDSLDSVVMLYTYAGVVESEKRFKLIERRAAPVIEQTVTSGQQSSAGSLADEKSAIDEVPNQTLTKDKGESSDPEKGSQLEDVAVAVDGDVEGKERIMKLKEYTTSTLGLLLTLMSVIIAFTISIIVFMGLIVDKCPQCQAAASKPDGGGLAGSWWRFWEDVNADGVFGYIGAGIVGFFVVTIGGFYLGRWVLRRYKAKEEVVEKSEVEE